MTGIASQDNQFDEILSKINQAKQKAYSSVNKELISLYWNIGEYISNKIEKEEWGQGVVEKLSKYIEIRQPNLKGYSKRNLFRMKQFYESYKNKKIALLAESTKNIKVPSLLAQISWTHNVEIFSRCKIVEEREFYIKLTIKRKTKY